MDLEKHAWVVDSWLKGERYAEIAKRLGRTPSAIQADIVLFCRKLGYDLIGLSGDARREVSRSAMDKYLAAGGALMRPEPRKSLPYGDVVATAMREYAMFLRDHEKLTYAEVGKRVGVSGWRASELVEGARRRERFLRRSRNLPFP